MKTTAPAGTSSTIRFRIFFEPLNAYTASGFGRALTIRMASSIPSTVITGSSGPKISSHIAGSSGSGSRITVGSIVWSTSDTAPPTAIVPFVASR